MGPRISKKRRSTDVSILIPEEKIQIHRLFENTLFQHQDIKALNYSNPQTSDTSSMSYNTLNTLANKCARILVDLVLDECRDKTTYLIGVCMKPSVSLILALLAVLKAGAAYLVIDPRLSAEKIEQLLNDTSVDMVVYDDNIIAADLFPAHPRYKIKSILAYSYSSNPANLKESERLSSESVDVIAAVMLTSAIETDKQKGVFLSHRAILNRLQWQCTKLPYHTKEKTVVFQTAASCVESIFELWPPLVCGLTVLILSKDWRDEPSFLIDILEHYRIKRLTIMPSCLDNLLSYLTDSTVVTLNKKNKPLSHVNFWFCTGEELLQETVLSFYDHFSGKQQLISFYGCTETTGEVMYFRCKRENALHLTKIPLGHPIDNNKIYLLNHLMQEVESGEIGELYVSGLNLSSGYTVDYETNSFLDNPFSTDAMYSRLFRTGDLCISLDTHILFIGRIDRLIEFGDENINLNAIEQSLGFYPMVKRCIVSYRVIAGVGRLLSFVKFQRNSPIDTKQQISHQIRKTLPIDLSLQIIMIASFPKFLNGRINRFEILKCFEEVHQTSRISGLGDYSYLNDEMSILYKELKEILRRTLHDTSPDKKFELDLDTNFFDVPATQLDAIQVISILRQRGYSVTVLDFISAKTLGEILKSMSRRDTKYQTDDDYINQFAYLNIVVIRLDESNRIEMIRRITDMSIQTGDIEGYLQRERRSMKYRKLLNELWQYMKYSFVVMDAKDFSLLGFSISITGSVVPRLYVSERLDNVLRFYEFLVAPLRAAYSMHSNPKILLTMFVATNERLSPAENIAVLHIMENKKIRLALEHGYSNLLWINPDILTQQMASECFYYKILLDYQINRYYSEIGTQPFRQAPDSKRVLVNWKVISTTALK